MRDLATTPDQQVSLLGRFHAFVVQSSDRRQLCALGDTFTILDVLRAHRDLPMIQARGAAVVQALAFGSAANCGVLAEHGTLPLLFAAFRKFRNSLQAQTTCVAAFAALIPHGDLAIRMWRRDVHTLILEAAKIHDKGWELLCFASKGEAPFAIAQPARHASPSPVLTTATALRGLVLRVGTGVPKALEAQGACRLLKSRIERVNELCSAARDNDSVEPGESVFPASPTPDSSATFMPEAAIAARRLAADTLVSCVGLPLLLAHLTRRLTRCLRLDAPHAQYYGGAAPHGVQLPRRGHVPRRQRGQPG